MKNNRPNLAELQAGGLANRSLGVLLVVVCLLASGCSMKRFAVNKLGDALAGGGTTFSSDDDPEFIKSAAPFSLKLMESLLNDYHRAKGIRDEARMRDKKLSVVDQRCTSVLAFMLAMAKDSRARNALPDELRATLTACKEVRNWVR